MRSGPIRPEVREKEVDRGGVTCSVWEQGTADPLDPPPLWAAALSLAPGDVASLLASARAAFLVVGQGAAATALLEQSLVHLPLSCRLYVYASRSVEADARLRHRLEKLADRVLPRLGSDPPADWLVVDAGRAARLLVGPSGQERRWIIPADGSLARTLFEAARALFWFHAGREGLPDYAGAFKFRDPLPAPFPNPGNDVALPAGRLVVDGALPDPVPDAEIRVVSNGETPGRAGVVFLPPSPKNFDSVRALAGGMTRVVWSETGLPKTTVSRERVVLDLVETSISLQLEWPKQDAIDLYHRLSKVAQKPAWQFYLRRQLAEIAGPVILEGAGCAGDVKDSVVVRAPDVVVSLEGLDGTEPDSMPEPPPLVRRVTYRWRAIPVPLPTGAREAELVRRWRAVDEWARRQVDDLRRSLAAMEVEERGFLDRLRARLTGHDELRQRRSRLRERLDELGEVPPSQYHEGATDLVRRISDAGREVREILEHAHGARVNAEDAVAEAQQRADWAARTGRAADNLDAKRAELGPIQQHEATATSTLDEAEKKLRAAIDVVREARQRNLIEKRNHVAAELEVARRERDAQPGAARHLRKEAARKVADVEQRLARLKRDIEAISGWSPPATDLEDERAAVARAREERDKARDVAKAVAGELRLLEQLAAEPFAFRAPPRPAAPAVPPDVAAPSIPEEAPPELGDLFEHRGKRYLAVKTWEQVQRAIPVARRLKSELVSLTDHNE